MNDRKYKTKQLLSFKIVQIILINKNDSTSQSNILSTNNDLQERVRQSYDFWHKKYIDSPINYPLVWKKVLESNSEIIKRIEAWKNNSKQSTEILIQQFFEMWSYAIKESNFEIAKKSMYEWEGFWKNITDEQFKAYSKVLQMIEEYWKDIQSKNIE